MTPAPAANTFLSGSTVHAIAKVRVERHGARMVALCGASLIAGPGGVTAPGTVSCSNCLAESA